ncbi:SpoIID/LytB domain-containing protein [Intestinimonas timonensis]|uniref:SpoIID/LytB domain-containing protein n=1 Tax=Intestinimonas timonensis TaxID=1689270 RepID=UPI0010317948|nr:SpoIID/LytB domain-containing protein [Intestinimonas timonensis]
MGKSLIRFAAVLLAAALCIGCVTFAAGSETKETLRVGLFYGSTALPGANLENSVGSGYRFGWYDDDLTFHQLGSSSETQISVVKTQNVTLSGGNYVDGTGSVMVGCFHLQLPTTYTSFEEAQTAASTVSNGFPAWIEGTYYVRVGVYTSKEEALSAQTALGLSNATVVGTSGYAVTVVVTKTGKPIFQFDGGQGYSLGIQPGLDDSVKTVTWFKGYRYYGGFQYRRSGGNITVINIVDLEDYIKGVLPYEMNNTWPLEALKAQAVCARTYAATISSSHASSGFDVCNNTHCQMYQGLNLANDRTDQAVEETAGEYVRYQDKPAVTYYSASDGGATEDVRNIWDSTANLPHLKGVIDPYEADLADSISQYNWSVTVSKSEIASKLQSKGYNCGTIVDAYVAELSETGNPKTVTFVDSNGKKWSFGPETLRIWFSLRSNRFTVGGGSGSNSYYVNGTSDTLSSVSGAYVVNGDGTVSAISGTPYVATSSGTEILGSSSSTSSGSSVTFTGSGYGHNVGMSQQGARAMALRGMDYIDILTFYFTDVTVG